MKAVVTLYAYIPGSGDGRAEIVIRSADDIGCAEIEIDGKTYQIELMLLAQALRCVDVRGVLR